MISWPRRASKALVRLFQPLQDIDVFVEDSGDEVFYSELFRRVASSEVTVRRVFSLHGRANVIAAAQAHDFSKRKAMFLIDGDYPWVRGEPAPDIHGLVRLDAYCIENLLIDGEAAVEIVLEETSIDREVASRKLQFDAWQHSIREPLSSLTIACAIANQLVPAIPTTSVALGRIISTSNGESIPSLDAAKVKAFCEELLNHAQVTHETESCVNLRQRIHGLPNLLDAVSGKDILLPLFDFHLRRACDCKVKRASLRVRLARHLSAARADSLARALTAYAR